MLLNSNLTMGCEKQIETIGKNTPFKDESRRNKPTFADIIISISKR
jgi:hypothetical protein